MLQGRRTCVFFCSESTRPWEKRTGASLGAKGGQRGTAVPLALGEETYAEKTC